MNHQPFETWIFSDDPLQPMDQDRLKDHLQTCEDCRQLSDAMNGVQKTFNAAHCPAPEPGFTQRWQARLAVYKQARQQRQMWILTLALLGLAALISLSILLIELGQVNWFYQISQFIANFSLLASRINQFWVIFRSINETLPVLTPIMIVFGVGSLAAAMALFVTWFSSMVQLFQPVE